MESGWCFLCCFLLIHILQMERCARMETRKPGGKEKGAGRQQPASQPTFSHRWLFALFLLVDVLPIISPYCYFIHFLFVPRGLDRCHCCCCIVILCCWRGWFLV
ncbi:hypothetical protein B0T17DRAFT_532511 [Bombardia bombarda]|uniref:Uncharacterized protein n=1 Tax=Bombardia bombarda TaxID=252184 RepID=A0AA40C511_9PEZI|nr:hypothetical protein B0T17DRAFT_532511 [Bombardia bombarda]